MSSGRNRDYRKQYRQYESRNAWPYPSSRPFQFQRSRRAEEDDNFCLATRLIDLPVKIHSCHVDFELVSNSSIVNQKKYAGKAPVIILDSNELETSSQFGRNHSRGIECSSVAALSNAGSKLNGIVKVEQCRLSGEEEAEGPPVPKVSLFPETKIVLGWRKALSVGAGMCNLGNTCYLNSTLQALFYIPSFCNWLMNEGDHDSCEDLDENGDRCIICAMSHTLKCVKSKSGNVIKPSLIYSRLKSICRHMCQGRQEDAHEFLRYLLEKMELSYLDRFKGKQLDSASKETTPLHRIFGGYMRTEICCGICKGTSTTFQHFQDLLLDIRRSSSLEDALRVFFSRESLEGDDGGGDGDAYKCSRCQRKGHCIKRNFIQVPPKVLCIQLKRFTAMGGKLVKTVTYPEKLDIASYVYSKQNGLFNSSPTNHRRTPLVYHLTSIVSHCGGSMNSGHYTATARSSNGAYFEFDDAMVHQVSLHSALGMSAYILMYEMIPSCSEPIQTFTPFKTSSSYASSAESPTSSEKQRTFVIPPNRPKLMFASSPRPVNGVVAASSPAPNALSNSTASPSAKERDRVCLGIKSSNQATTNGVPPASQTSRLNGTCLPRGLSESNEMSVKKLSPESQTCVSQTSPKVNGLSPSKTSRSSNGWSSSGVKSSSPALFPFSMAECNRIKLTGMPPSMFQSLASRNSSTSLDSSSSSNSREGAENSLSRLSQLGVLVGVSGKGRRAVDHLVPYPVSGDSSDEEEERKRKASENGLSKPQTPASEMTISGNLTPDATALATKRGWTVAESSSLRRVQGNVGHSRKELLRDKVEVASVRERTGVGEVGGSSGGEGKKASEEEGHLEERLGSSSSPCSSTSSHFSDSHDATSIKSILKIFDGSSCKLMEGTESKNQTSPSKCKVLANGTGSIVEGVLERNSSSLSKVEEWLNSIDCEPENWESSRIEKFLWASTPCKLDKDNINFDISKLSSKHFVDHVLQGRNVLKKTDNIEHLIQLPFQKSIGKFSISKTGHRVRYNLDELFFNDDQTSSESDDMSVNSSGYVPLESKVFVNEAGKEQLPDTCHESCNFSWPSSSSFFDGKGGQSSTSSTVSVLSRPDSRSLISNLS